MKISKFPVQRGRLCERSECIAVVLKLTVVLWLVLYCKIPRQLVRYLVDCLGRSANMRGTCKVSLN